MAVALGAVTVSSTINPQVSQAAPNKAGASQSVNMVDPSDAPAAADNAQTAPSSEEDPSLTPAEQTDPGAEAPDSQPVAEPPAAAPADAEPSDNSPVAADPQANPRPDTSSPAASRAGPRSVKAVRGAHGLTVTMWYLPGATVVINHNAFIFQVKAVRDSDGQPIAGVPIRYRINAPTGVVNKTTDVGYMCTQDGTSTTYPIGTVHTSFGNAGSAGQFTVTAEYGAPYASVTACQNAVNSATFTSAITVTPANPSNPNTLVMEYVPRMPATVTFEKMSTGDKEVGEDAANAHLFEVKVKSASGTPIAWMAPMIKSGLTITDKAGGSDPLGGAKAPVVTETSTPGVYEVQIWSKKTGTKVFNLNVEGRDAVPANSSTREFTYVPSVGTCQLSNLTVTPSSGEAAASASGEPITLAFTSSDASGAACRGIAGLFMPSISPATGARLGTVTEDSSVAGRYYVKVGATAAGNYTATVKLGTASKIANLKFTADQNSLRASLKGAPNGPLKPTAGLQYTVTVKIVDQFGNPLSNAPVQFTKSGVGTVVGNLTGLTDANGEYAIGVREAGVEGTALVTAKYGKTGGNADTDVRTDPANSSSAIKTLSLVF
ncbi:MAG: Ig-like domain-containing protein, partial [Bifidobacteriaceae bacterium]|nr:Ig-like domain-containing protein [Bifidobacteriaceae bacterium]